MADIPLIFLSMSKVIKELNCEIAFNENHCLARLENKENWDWFSSEGLYRVPTKVTVVKEHE